MRRMRISASEGEEAMEIQIADSSRSLVVSLQGDMDRTVYGEGLKQIRQAFYSAPRDLVIDCEGLLRVSPVAVAGLLRLKDAVEQEGKTLRFRNLAPAVRDVLERGGVPIDEEARGEPPARLAASVRPVEPEPVFPEAPPAEELPQEDPAPVAPEAPVVAPARSAAAGAGVGASLGGEIQRLKQEIALAAADVEAAREEARAARTEAERSSKALSDARHESALLAGENERLLKELEARPADASSENPAENDRLRVELVALRKERDRLREDLERLRMQHQTVRDAYGAAEREIQRVGELKQKLALAEDELKAARADLEYAREKMTSTVALNQSLEEHGQVLQQDLLSAREQVRRYQARIEELKRFVNVELA